MQSIALFALMAKVQTLTEMKAMLAAAGLRPRHPFGQNFFVDGNLLRRLVDSAEIEEADTVVEVGGGTGVLSDLLAERCGRLLIVEIDRNLAAMLKDRFASLPHVVVHQGDALANKHQLCEFLLTELRRPSEGRRMLVANLPYNIATPLLVDLLIAVPDMSRFCFTVQKEVADRFAAAPRTKAYGPVSILMQTLCDVRVVAHVPPQSFWPRPNVDSQMLRLDRLPNPSIPPSDAGKFAEFLKKGFAHRRKLLTYNLDSFLTDAELQPDFSRSRADELSVADWIDIYRRLIR